MNHSTQNQHILAIGPEGQLRNYIDLLEAGRDTRNPDTPQTISRVLSGRIKESTSGWSYAYVPRRR